jgi:hypothetical protein
MKIKDGFMKSIVLAILAILILTTSAYSETTSGGYAACRSKSLFDEFASAVIKEDSNTLLYLLSNGCIIIKPGIPISVLDSSGGTAKIRAYVGDTSLVMWTYIENIQR